MRLFRLVEHVRRKTLDENKLVVLGASTEDIHACVSPVFHYYVFP